MRAFVLFVTVVAFNLQSLAANVANSRDSPIQYPGSVAKDEEVPEACKDLTYCTIKPADYPQEKFNKMFKDYKPIPQPQLVVVVDINNRFSDDDEENCKSEVSYEPLYKVRQRRDQPWRTVIQAPGQDYVQRVRLETCSKVNAPCLKSCSATDFTTTCKQTYNTWEVLVSKGDNESEKIKTELPVCCSCQAEPIPFMNRFGVDKH